MGVSTDMEIDLTKKNTTEAYRKQVELHKQGHNLLAVVYERQTYAEIRPLLDKITENPHCVAVFWKKGRRGFIAKRGDGKLFEFDIIRK